MDIKINNKNGITLNTAKKYCDSDISIILDESIFPKGNYEIDANGTFDVTDYETVTVDIKKLDTTATADDILLGKTAHTADGKVEGTIETYDLLTSDGPGVGSLKRLLNYTKSTANMFQDNRNIISIDDYIKYSDTENVEYMTAMFRFATSLTDPPNLNTSNVIDMGYMFASTAITETPKYDFSKVRNIRDAFSSCKNLVTVNQMSLPNAVTIVNLFNSCSSIEYIPEILDTTNVDNAGGICYGCTKLETFDGFDMTKITSHNQTSNFVGCVNLKNIKLKNIKVNITIGSGDGTGDSDYGTMLTVESLVGIIAELINVNAARTLTVGTANLEKLSSVYIKLLDDDGSGKLPFEVCEQSDDGAILITDYIVLKNWAIA